MLARDHVSGLISDASTPQESRSCTRNVVMAGGAIAAIWVAAASWRIVADSVVPWDSKNQFYAFFRFLAASLHSGTAPFWNPYHYGGHPSVADPQSFIFSPFFLLWAAFDRAPSLRAFDLVVSAHLLAGGLAMAAIGWRARWPTAACVLAAALFMFGGAAAGRLQHTGIILSYGLFPVALLLLQLALQRRSYVNAILFSFIAAGVALGRNQVSLLLCFVLIAATIGEILGTARPLHYLRDRLPVLATMAVAGAALVAVPVLLTLQFAAWSNRPAELLDAALKGSLYPANLSTLVVAKIFGTHTVYWGPGGTTLPNVAYTDDSFNYMFVGVVPVVLLLWFGVASGGVWRRGRRLVAAVLVISLLFMLGRYTPVFAWAFDVVPGIDMFRRPIDANFVFGMAMAILAGHLLADYMRDGLPPARILAIAIVAASALGLLVWAVIFSQQSGHGAQALTAVAMTAPIILLVVGILACAKDRRARTAAAAVVTGVAIAELLYWNAAFRLNAESRLNYAVLEQPAGADAQAIAILEQALRADHDRGEYPRVEVLGMGGPWQNLAVVRGWEATNGYNPLRIGFYDRLVSPGEANWLAELREFPGSFEDYDSALARTLGLQYLVLGQPVENVPHMARRPVADVLLAGPKIWIYRLQNRAQRLTLTQRVTIADADATNTAGQLLASPAADSVVIDDDTPPAGDYSPAAAQANAGQARIASWQPGRIAIEVDATQASILALHGIYYPGWTAELDGQVVPILRADVLFRGVEVPAGHHRVVFQFTPFSLANLADALKTAFGRSDLR
jgi:Bacterial membrane protein YfhO